jgi:hypothetical protein
MGELVAGLKPFETHLLGLVKEHMEEQGQDGTTRIDHGQAMPVVPPSSPQDSVVSSHG